MFEEDLQARVRRIIRGSFYSQDFDRIYLGLRGKAHGADCFREIGDFVAHRDHRQKGLVTQVGKDVFTSLDVWSFGLRDKQRTLPDILRAADANLRLASEEQLRRGCDCGRQTAATRISKAKSKLARGVPLKRAEEKTLLYLGNTFIWKPAFDSRRLQYEFRETLLRNRLLTKEECETLDPVYRTLSLHAISVMHGSSIELDTGASALLIAGCANERQCLEVKMKITFDDWLKPISAPVCLFLTDLAVKDCCSESLFSKSSLPMADDWSFPIEVNAKGRLMAMH